MKHILSHSPGVAGEPQGGARAPSRRRSRGSRRGDAPRRIWRGSSEILAEQARRHGRSAAVSQPRRSVPPRDRGDRRQPDLHGADRRAVRLAGGFPCRPGLGARAGAADAAGASRHPRRDRDAATSKASATAMADHLLRANELYRQPNPCPTNAAVCRTHSRPPEIADGERQSRCDVPTELRLPDDAQLV